MNFFSCREKKFDYREKTYHCALSLKKISCRFDVGFSP